MHWTNQKKCAIISTYHRNIQKGAIHMNTSQFNTWHQLRSVLVGLDRMHHSSRCRLLAWYFAIVNYLLLKIWANAPILRKFLIQRVCFCIQRIINYLHLVWHSTGVNSRVAHGTCLTGAWFLHHCKLIIFQFHFCAAPCRWYLVICLVFAW